MTIPTKAESQKMLDEAIHALRETTARTELEATLERLIEHVRSIQELEVVGLNVLEEASLSEATERSDVPDADREARDAATKRWYEKLEGWAFQASCDEEFSRMELESQLKTLTATMPRALKLEVSPVTAPLTLKLEFTNVTKPEVKITPDDYPF